MQISESLGLSVHQRSVRRKCAASSQRHHVRLLMVRGPVGNKRNNAIKDLKRNELKKEKGLSSYDGGDCVRSSRMTCGGGGGRGLSATSSVQGGGGGGGGRYGLVLRTEMRRDRRERPLDGETGVSGAAGFPLAG